ncbi:MAG: UbiA family prenyltransferase [Thermoplasmata archaeon]|nr:UbiA family prenyltransferase [Thermoplasmata archaeon]HHH77736.1 prenyltransferase [Thermoplasmatales archaeon]
MNECSTVTEKLKAVWQLARLEHGLMIAVAILIGALIAGRGLPPADKFLFAFLTALFLEAGTFALNDYFDLEVDRRNRRMDRPLVRGELNPSSAVYMYFILVPAGLAASFMVNMTCFEIAAINVVLATLYDVKLKETKVVGNFYIAFVMAIPFIFGATAVSPSIPFIIFLIAFIAFLSGVAREIMKDVMDFEGDAARRTKSFPTYLGKRGANAVASLFYILAVVLSFIPFVFSIDSAYYRDYTYLSIVLVTDIMLVYTAVSIISRVDAKSLGRFRKISLLGIFVGLVAFLAGAFA